jgi:hypothetical protein
VLVKVTGEAYFDKNFRNERFKMLKKLGYKNLRKGEVKAVDLGGANTVFVVEWEVEEPKSIVIN